MFKISLLFFFRVLLPSKSDSSGSSSGHHSLLPSSSDSDFSSVCFKDCIPYKTYQDSSVHDVGDGGDADEAGVLTIDSLQFESRLPATDVTSLESNKSLKKMQLMQGFKARIDPLSNLDCWSSKKNCFQLKNGRF